MSTDPHAHAAMPPRDAGFNASAWALTHKPFVGFMMVDPAVRRRHRPTRNLGRDEDPPFTIKVMVVRAMWPGADAEQMAKQVTDRMEKSLESLQYLDVVQQLHEAWRKHAHGHAEGQHAARSRCRTSGTRCARRSATCAARCPPARSGLFSTTISATCMA